MKQYHPAAVGRGHSHMPKVFPILAAQTNGLADGWTVVVHRMIARCGRLD